MLEQDGQTETASLPTQEEEEKRISWAIYTPFYDEGDHLKDLVTTERKLDDAGKLYLEQKEFFAANRKKYQSLLDQLAEGLNEPKKAGLKKSLSALDALQWPAPIKKLATIRGVLSTARVTLDAYPSHDIFKEPDFRATEATRLETLLADVTSRIKNDAPGKFKSFDHFGDTSFFSVHITDVSPVVPTSALEVSPTSNRRFHIQAYLDQDSHGPNQRSICLVLDRPCLEKLEIAVRQGLKL